MKAFTIGAAVAAAVLGFLVLVGATWGSPIKTDALGVISVILALPSIFLLFMGSSLCLMFAPIISLSAAVWLGQLISFGTPLGVLLLWAFILLIAVIWVGFVAKYYDENRF